MSSTFEKIIKQHSVIKLQWIDYCAALGSSILSFVVYLFCMTPGVPAGDGGELAVAIHYLGVGHAPGYPLHSFLGKLFSVLPIGGSVVWKTNVFSGVCASVAVFFTALIAIRILLGMGESPFYSKIFGACGGLFLAFFPIFWSQAIFCEVYSVGTMFQVAILWILVLWVDDVWVNRLQKKTYFGEGHLSALSFLFGVAIAAHLSVVMLQFLVGGTILAVLWGVVLPQKELTVAQSIHGRKCVLFLLICLGVLLCGFLATVVNSEIIGVGSQYGFGDIREIIFILFLPNAAFAAMYWGYPQIAPEKWDPKNYLQQGTFLVIQMFFLLYLGYFINAYLYIRGNANPPINWGGIGESSDILEKLSKFVSVIFRKQYGNQGRVDVSLASTFFSLEWILWILAKQVTWPLIVLMLLGGFALVQTHLLYACMIIGGFVTFTLQMAVYLRVQDVMWSQVSRVFFLFSLVPMALLCSFGLSKMFSYCPRKIHKSLAFSLMLGVLFVDTPFWAGFFPKALLENDRREDKVCQDYAQDMLQQCPSGSILLTEGPDSEVFPLLYFRYVEKVRPDMDIFDQKGNIFPRIYGNFFAPNFPRFQESYDLVRDLRDFQLCSTGKPVFFAFERNLQGISYRQLEIRYQNLMQKTPMLRDSVLGIWAKDFTKSGLKDLLAAMVPKSVFDGAISGQENLYDVDLQELGPWFLRQEGILYRVWPAKFAALQVLEYVGSATKSKILQGIYEGLKVPWTQSESQLDVHLVDLQRQGFISKSSSGEYFLIKTPWKTHVDWENTYAVLKNYRSVQNKIIHWDYLVPEVFSEYAKELLQDLSKRRKVRAIVLGPQKVLIKEEEELQFRMFSSLERNSIDLRANQTFYENFWDGLKDEKGNISQRWIQNYQNLFYKFYPESTLVLGETILMYADRHKKWDASSQSIQEIEQWSEIFRKFKTATSFFRQRLSKGTWFQKQWESKTQFKRGEEILSMQKQPEMVDEILQQTDFPFYKIAKALVLEQQGKGDAAVQELIKLIRKNPKELIYVTGLLNLLKKYESVLDANKLGFVVGFECLQYSAENLLDFKNEEYLDQVFQSWSNFVKKLAIHAAQKKIVVDYENIVKSVSQLISVYKTAVPTQQNYNFKRRVLNDLLGVYRECTRIGALL